MTHGVCDKYARLYADLRDGIRGAILEKYNSNDFVPIKYFGCTARKQSERFNPKTMGDIVFKQLHEQVFGGEDAYDCAGCRKAMANLIQVVFIDKHGVCHNPLLEAIKRITGVTIEPPMYWAMDGIMECRFDPHDELINNSPTHWIQNHNAHYHGFTYQLDIDRKYAEYRHNGHECSYAVSVATRAVKMHYNLTMEESRTFHEQLVSTGNKPLIERSAAVLKVLERVKGVPLKYLRTWVTAVIYSTPGFSDEFKTAGAGYRTRLTAFKSGHTVLE